jgi:hypothetical protein
LLRRAEEGGSYHVKLSLARSAMWVQALGFLDTSVQQSLPETDRYPAKRTTVKSAYGDISYLQSPLSFSDLRLPEVNTIEPYGASPAAWRETQSTMTDMMNKAIGKQSAHAIKPKAKHG